jgi:drug/metabolite transporter (DMT)-like permease
VLFGGVVGPALLMIGLAQTAASTSSLLLNLEGPFTALIAWVVVREHTHARIVLGFVLIALGATLLTVDFAHATFALSPGALFVAGACVCWAVDNNLTQSASSADPMLIASTKGLVAGAVNIALAFVFAGAAVPHAASIASALCVGLLGYGVSLVLFVLGLRHLGTARTGAYFSTAPFVGALLSIAFLHEGFAWPIAAAGALMAIGVVLHLTEHHGHEHEHDAMTHSHEHVHDEHHRHEHAPGTPPEPHVHEHVHERLVHAHAHAPDIHHRHSH